MSVCAVLILLELFSIFGRTKFIINSNKAHYKISTTVAFCPGGLLSGGLMSGGLLSVHHLFHIMQRHFSDILILDTCGRLYYTQCLKKAPILKRYSSKLYGSILMTFGRNIQNTLEWLVCFTFLVGLLFCDFSSFKPDT